MEAVGAVGGIIGGYLADWLAVCDLGAGFQVAVYRFQG
jgi:hypothetical protein